MLMLLYFLEKDLSSVFACDSEAINSFYSLSGNHKNEIIQWMLASLIWQNLGSSHGLTLLKKISGQVPLVQWINETFVFVKEWWLCFVPTHFSLWLAYGLLIVILFFCHWTNILEHTTCMGLVLLPLWITCILKLESLLFWDKYSELLKEGMTLLKQ